MKSWLLAVVLATVAIAPLLYLVYHGGHEVTSSDSPVTTIDFASPPQPTMLEVGSVLRVGACGVIDGYRFQMFLEGDQWIEAHLPNATQEEATAVVIELLKNNTTNPTVKLLRRTGNFWIVDFRLTVNGKQERLINLLQAKNLLLE